MICINDDYQYWFKINAYSNLTPIYSAQTDYLILNENDNKIVIQDISDEDLELAIDVSKLIIKKDYTKTLRYDNLEKCYKFKKVTDKNIKNSYPCNSIECNYDFHNSIISILLIGVDKLTDDKMSFLPKHFYCTKYASVDSYIVNSIHVIKYLSHYVKRQILTKIRAIGKFMILYNKYKIVSCMESLD